jgi:UDP-N-acetylglucosamine 3-dehydrogenase
VSAVLRAGLIGLGSMGRHHARVLKGLEGVELVAVVDPMGDQHGAAQGVPVLSTVEELIGLGIDYAVVACPTGLHEPVGLALAEAGVCALIEKPVADTVVGARHLVEAFESRGLVAGVGHIERFNPALQSMRARLEAGELGEVFQVVTRRQGPFPHRIADVGVVKDLATHLGHRRARLPHRRHPHRRPDLPLERRRGDRVGGPARLPRRLRGGHGPIRHTQA